MNDPLKPSPSLLVCLGSIAVHTDELMGPGGHTFDRVALQTLFANPELKAWIQEMTALGMLPVQRLSPATKQAVQDIRNAPHTGRKRRGPIHG